MKLSVLDLSPIPSGATATEALQNSVALAQHVEQLGFERVWYAEHHNAAAVACSCPEVVIPRVATLTERIRVGAGGIMLPNHAPLKVAETFRVLHAMFPGRIDLGLGRAPGTDPRTAAALRRDALEAKRPFSDQLAALRVFLEGGAEARPAFAGTTVAVPTGVAAPPLFILSSSGVGADVAADAGLGLAFAHHMNPRDAAGIVNGYRARFVASAARSSPYAIVSAAVLCAPTQAEAEALAEAAELAMVRFAQGLRDLPFPSPAEVRAHAWRDDDAGLRAMFRQAPIVGAPEKVAEGLERLAAETGADELMLMTMAHDPAVRRRSFTLVAEALGRRGS